MSFKKYILGLLIIISLFSLVYAANIVLDSTWCDTTDFWYCRVDNWWQQFNIRNWTWVISNSWPAIFVPAKTDPEFNSFVSNKPAWVTLCNRVDWACWWADWWQYFSSPDNLLCNLWTPSSVSWWDWNPWSWSCSNTCWWNNASCSAYAQCSIPWWWVINHWAFVTAYSTSSPSCWTSCSSISQNRTCNQWILSWSYLSSSCTESTCTYEICESSNAYRLISESTINNLCSYNNGNIPWWCLLQLNENNGPWNSWWYFWYDISNSKWLEWNLNYTLSGYFGFNSRDGEVSIFSISNWTCSFRDWESSGIDSTLDFSLRNNNGTTKCCIKLTKRQL